MLLGRLRGRGLRGFPYYRARIALSLPAVHYRRPSAVLATTVPGRGHGPRAGRCWGPVGADRLGGGAGILRRPGTGTGLGWGPGLAGGGGEQGVAWDSGLMGR